MLPFVVILLSLLLHATGMQAQGIASTPPQIEHIDTRSYTVHSIFKDRDGVVWLGTERGLITYSQLFVSTSYAYVRHPEMQDIIDRISQDNAGRLWLATQANRYMCYNPADNSLINDVDNYFMQLGIGVENSMRVSVDGGGRLWIYNNKALWVHDPQTRHTQKIVLLSPNEPVLAVSAEGHETIVITPSHIITVSQTTIQARLLANNVREFPFGECKLMLHANGDVWLATASQLYRYHRATKTWTTYTEQMFDIIGLSQHTNGTVYVATTNCGLFLFDAEGNETGHMQQSFGSQGGLKSSHLNYAYFDRSANQLWIVYGKQGMSVMSQPIDGMRLFKPTPTAQHAYPDDVLAFTQADEGSVWIGTEDHGAYTMNLESDTRHQPQSDHNGKTVVALFTDSHHRRWTGLYRQGLHCSDGRSFFAGKSPFRIIEGGDGRIYVTLVGDGIWVIDPTTGQSRQIPTENPWIMDFAIRNNTLYAASPSYVYQIDTRTFSNKMVPASQMKDDGFRAGNKTLLLDSRGWLWLVSYKNFSDINVYDTRRGRTFVVDGTRHYRVNSLIEDNGGEVWLGTDRGLLRIRVADEKTPRFDTYCFQGSPSETDKFYNERAALRLADGRLLFGTADGVQMVSPNLLEKSHHAADKRCPLIISMLSVNGESVSPGQQIDGKVMYSQDLTALRQLNLRYNENNLYFTVSPKDFSADVSSTFYYQLQGLNDTWLPMEMYGITLSNIPAGTYHLRIREQHAGDESFNDYDMLTISVATHPLLSVWAYMVYALLLAVATALLYRYFRDRYRYNVQMREMKMRAAQEAKINEMKISFFTNISHDLRTPLTLIITPVEEMMNTVKDKVQRDTLGIVYANARRLYQLVNQILDFRKIENTHLTLDESFDDIVSFLTQRVRAFEYAAKQNDIALHIDSDTENCEISFDKDKIGKAIDNLLSNAFKFTPKGGSVSIKISTQPESIAISVADTGIGISEADRSHIFERFYVSKRNSDRGIDSTGIGLHIVKEYVELHGGKISVADNTPKGTVFTIILPIVAASTRTSTKNIPTPHSSPLTPRKSSTLLVVEDNPDLLSYMCRMLGRDYTVCQATDGRQALDVLQGTDVDLIISDVMMEGMDGLELCRTLKSDITTSHIPVILLTARALASDELEGLQTGADDYIVKPFHLDILRQRIINLLERTRRAQERFSKEPQIEPSEVTVTTLDEEFLAKAIQVVEEHIDEPSFSVDDLSEQMFMHRTNFYRKIQFITGKTPAQFIRLLRLKRARQLLSRGNVLVSQVAFQVGFNSPKKFARYFKEEFGQYPSEYAKSMESTNPIDKNDNL